jgi:hypothetical protein
MLIADAPEEVLKLVNELPVLLETFVIRNLGGPHDVDEHDDGFTFMFVDFHGGRLGGLFFLRRDLFTRH